MYKNITLLALTALCLCACKPTPRTARPPKLQPDSEQQPPTPPADEQQPEIPAPADNSRQTEESAEHALLIVNITRQPHNRLTPWEKQPPSQRRQAATYLGQGLVLTHGAALQNATYVELSLPDGTQTVPARIVRHDNDLALGVLTVMSPQDASIFDTRRPCAIGEPLQRTDRAELWGTLNGNESLRVPLLVQAGSTGSEGLPRLTLQAEMAVPELYSAGAPVMQDGKLVGLSAGYESTGRKLTVINAELLRRFLERSQDAPTGVPALGIEISTLDDPVFRRYLQLQEGQTGAYISKVLPVGAAASADVRVGDVITAIEGMPVDNLARCDLPIYGMTHISTAARYLRPLGDTIRLTISRSGKTLDISLPLNTDARDKALLRTESPDEAPRYIVWGGLVFQPLTATYLQTLKTQARGTLPVEFLELEEREKELLERGMQELTALTLIIPTPATLGYDNLGFCVVEKVNGREPHNFAEFAALLDEPTPCGITELSINKPPYKIYMDRAAAEATNDSLRRSAIPHLRRQD